MKSTFGQPLPEPGTNGVILISGTKAWGIEALNRKAVAWLAKNGKPLRNDHVTVIFHIYLNRKGTICDIQYWQGLGQHVYTIQFDDNGEISHFFDEGVAHESIGPTERKFLEKYEGSFNSTGTNEQHSTSGR